MGNEFAAAYMAHPYPRPPCEGVLRDSDLGIAMMRNSVAALKVG